MKRLRALVAGLSACLALVAGAARAADADVSLIFVGDVMLDDGPGRLIAAGGDPLAKVAPLLAGADYRIANLECSVSTRGQGLPGKPYAFRTSPDALRVMQGRFDAVAVANNHSGDFGSEAFVDTLEHARRAGIQAFGGGRNLREAHAPLWIHRNGLRIAVLAYNEYKPRSFEAGASRPGVAWSEDDEVISDIRAARKAGAHIVIPFMHWGWEGRPVPSHGGPPCSVPAFSRFCSCSVSSSPPPPGRSRPPAWCEVRRKPRPSPSRPREASPSAPGASP